MGKKFFLCIILILLFGSCSLRMLSYEEWRDRSNFSNNDVDVYIGGFYYLGAPTSSNIPCYWKNGSRVDMEYIYAYPSNAVTSICLDGEDVYCGGWYWNGSNNCACYWKNGKIQKLNLIYMQGSLVNSVCYSNGVVYSAGYNTNADALPCIWKNEKQEMLKMPAVAKYAEAKEIFVDPDTLDIYIAGDYTDILSIRYACYWKNGGECIPLSGEGSDANSIVVSNGKVYIAGNYTSATVPSPCYWIDGSLKALSDPGPSGGLANGITLYNGDIFTTGYNANVATYQAALWKNESLIWQETTLNTTANAISIFNNDIYISGNDTNATPYACFWKNGIKTNLSVPAGATQPHTTGIAVKARK
jgi:hypothetical protein